MFNSYLKLRDYFAHVHVINILQIWPWLLYVVQTYVSFVAFALLRFLLWITFVKKTVTCPK
jgi:hypothetical protein